ncbi:MAG: helix-turn-helix domain-containing protein [Nitriliruptoraceae bacterium]|nr:helix-turn-helix domain-containing protein [Nitriliruptoraceae bacterium]
MLEDVPTDQDMVALRARVAANVSALRARSGRSLADLSMAAGIGKSTLHAIEAGDANPGIETLWALARALGVPFGHLLDPPGPPIRVLRAGQGPVAVSEDESMRAHLLASIAHGVRVELYDLDLREGPARDAEPHGDGTVEHVLVTSGRLVVGPVGGMEELGPGDLITFPADVAHRYEATEPGTRAVLLLEYA